MPSQVYSQQTVLKALKWLDSQPGNWTELIKDQNIAVKMYLKSQGKNKEEESAFKKELRPFLKTGGTESSPSGKQSRDKEEELGAFLTNKSQALPPRKEDSPSPPLKNNKELFVYGEREALKNRTVSEDRPVPESQHVLTRTPFPENQKTESLFLDEKSLEALKKTKQQLNLQRGGEALRLLIQLGRNSLEKLLSKP